MCSERGRRVSNRRILVVDDEADLCEILRFDLESEGFSVDTALSAEEALGMIESPTGNADYDLLLLDVMLGGMSGIELAGRLRAAGRTTPIIFLTARDTHDDQLRGFDAGADDYIAKPFSFDTVLARIRAVLRRSATAAAPPAHQPQLDTLTRRDYLIYQLVLSHPGRYFSREEILHTVWPNDTLVGERSVDVHIARLRKKLGPDGSRISGKTGFGYGLV